MTDKTDLKQFMKQPKQWWENSDTLHSVASYAVEIYEFTTAEEMRYFFEKPWKFDELYEAYDNDQSVQGELMDERRATL